MASQRAIVESLRGTWLFQSCTPRELSRIAKLGTVVEIAAGEEMVRRNERARRFLTILDGRAVVERPGSEPKRIARGAAVGEIALLDGGPHSATVRAISSCNVFSIGGEDFAQLLVDVPTAVKIAEALALRLRRERIERLRTASKNQAPETWTVSATERAACPAAFAYVDSRAGASSI
jgi:CRP-like cAMP-binding protein